MDPESLAEDASACLSLAYKYTSLFGCVQHQRPQLLSDPKLSHLAMQIELAQEQFEARVQALAVATQA